MITPALPGVFQQRRDGLLQNQWPAGTASADWDRIAIAGARASETAAGPEELARSLEEVFGPVAPTVRVFPTGRTPPLPDELRAGGNAVAWEHHGLEKALELASAGQHP